MEVTQTGAASNPKQPSAAGVRWLSDSEQVVWRSYLTATQLLNDRLDQELQRDAGVPHAYYEVLVRLSEVPDRRIRMSALAELSLSSRSRLSHAVARLEEAGWVRRESCPTDRRGQVAVLTDEGFAALAAAAPAHVEGVRTHLFDSLSSEQVGQLGEICATLTAHLVAGELGSPCGEGDGAAPVDEECTRNAG
jgi:DNA-binding MarR family transcriptional regulator